MSVRIQRHPHGPRLFLAGWRVHECHVGLAVLAVDLAGVLTRLWGVSLWSGAAGAAGFWMTIKDWRDLVPSLRDTGAWRLGMHRRFAPLRALRYADGLPTLTGAVAFAVGVVSLLSALTPNVAWRHHALLALEPVRAIPAFHSLAVPASTALIVTAFYLRGRRRRAWQVAVVLLVALGAVHLLKGLDLEEAALSWAAAALLWWGRGSFVVQHEPLGRGWLVALVLGTAIAAPALVVGVVWIASGAQATLPQAVLDTLDLLSWTRPSVAFGDELGALRIAVGGFGLAVIIIGGYLFFRPLPAPRFPPGPGVRQTVEDLVRSYGSDTLAFFKLRRDLHYLLAADRRAFLGYRVEGGVLLISGDPVGAPDALPALIRDALAFAEVRGLKLAAVGASGALLHLWQQAGLHALYVGDEAVIETGRFSLEGRAIRKVRQSVGRLERSGYRAQALALGTLDAGTRADLERISSVWRTGAPERGFSMAMDSLEGEQQGESVVVLARDGDGVVRGFLHFVPSYGRPAMSLSFMRRDRSTPNGLTEFLVVKSVELLRERSIEELSLNFSAFGRFLDRPRGRVERLLGKLVALGSRYFQMESLYRFNAKFSPRWEPRYLVYESILGLPRVGFAALRAEGQLPTLRA